MKHKSVMPTYFTTAAYALLQQCMLVPTQLAIVVYFPFNALHMCMGQERSFQELVAPFNPI